MRKGGRLHRGRAGQWPSSTAGKVKAGEPTAVSVTYMIACMRTHTQLAPPTPTARYMYSLAWPEMGPWDGAFQIPLKGKSVEGRNACVVWLRGKCAQPSAWRAWRA